MKINEIFLSIQGEGLLIGLPTLFVRTAGCDLRCRWCDTPYALLETQGTEWKLEDILAEVRKQGARAVCITGGDPLKQREETLMLTECLLKEDYRVVIETSGAYSIEGFPDNEKLMISMDLKLPSSAMEDRNMYSNIRLLRKYDQLKFIVADRRDYEFARRIMNEYNIPCEIIMTPVGGKEMRWLAEAVLADRLNVRVLPQLHKFIWGNERGR
jgi:7-carboxy-7-deazaguanine synthase